MTRFRTALVLGGKTGLVGQAMTDTLRAAGWDVTATDRKMLDFSQASGIETLEVLLEQIQPECIVNAVGYTQVDAAEDHPEEADFLNRAVPVLIGRAVEKFGGTLVHFSTDFVFNGRKRVPYRIDDATDPLSVYGRTKLAGEEALSALIPDSLIIVRTAWLFGPGQKNFVRTVLDKCGATRGLNVVHDQVGSPTYTVDLAAYTLKLIEAGGNGVYHIVNSGQASWCELASEAAAIAALECSVNPIPSSEYPQKAQRPEYSVLDTTRFESAAGITPRPWPQALREYVYREFPPE